MNRQQTSIKVELFTRQEIDMFFFLRPTPENRTKKCTLMISVIKGTTLKLPLPKNPFYAQYPQIPQYPPSINMMCNGEDLLWID
jgi:hypothetical protein